MGLCDAYLDIWPHLRPCLLGCLPHFASCGPCRTSEEIHDPEITGSVNLQYEWLVLRATATKKRVESPRSARFW